VCATDAPLAPHQLRRLALRPLLGLARAGSYAADGSGEIGVAFSTSRDARMPNERLNRLFAAAFEASWEAVHNCLVAARPAKRRDGSMQEAFPVGAIGAFTTQ
jgi:D-aminopeptidase